ncbi:hypothetical protein [Kitasatospora kifunensis]|uniref:Uncharacterized protein n=1 Tax=Kitasatospora kifunensis TaxID=58351 RepID=A0A7W7QYH7_KITKI|nr:hypothetical protein [Kitasatospora kifunensis]MBB4922161.1 hypothetical protein [Kitasatospora kifunensis]
MTITPAWEITWTELVDEFGTTENYLARAFSQAAADRIIADCLDNEWAENITVRKTKAKITNPEHPLYKAAV